MEINRKGYINMSILKILYKTGVLLICCMIQMIGILIEGCGKLCGKFVEILTGWHNKLMSKVKDGKYVKTTDIDIPL